MKSSPTKYTTLTFLKKSDNILLAKKKRGFGEHKWNGVGGKVEGTESIDDAAVRELQEEIGVTATELSKVAVLDFHYPNKDHTQQAHIYFVTKWDGEISESEEMFPQWFNSEEIPYSHMWPDDTHWLPLVLQGKLVTGQFYFDSQNAISQFSLTEVSKL